MGDTDHCCDDRGNVTDGGVDWVLIARAECVLALRLGITCDEAVHVLVFQAGLAGRSVIETAELVVAGQDLDPSRDPW